MYGENVQQIPNVISGGYCVGCGACAAFNPDAIVMERNRDGAFEASIIDPSRLKDDTDLICPFSNKSKNENQHADVLYGQSPSAHPLLGRFEQIYAGHVVEGDFRRNGSSGGATSWVASELLRLGHVDAVIHVHAHETRDGTDLFQYSVSRTTDDLQHGAKTRYYSVSMDKVLRHVKSENLSVAVVGVPCFIKAVRNLALMDEGLRSNVKFTLGIFCGHMKSAGFAESLAWQSGVRPRDIETVDFRVKVPMQPATAYAFSAIERGTGRQTTKPMSKLAGRRWDGGYFKLKACEFCDDVVGETADAAFGDAWLPEFADDSQGANVFIVRNPIVRDIVEQGMSSGRLGVQPLSADLAVQSQAAGFRDRREALQYRLWLTDQAGKWRPVKRVEPEWRHLSFIRRLTNRLRQFVRARSFVSFRWAKRLGTVRLYKAEMDAYHGLFKYIGLAERAIASRRK